MMDYVDALDCNAKILDMDLPYKPNPGEDFDLPYYTPNSSISLVLSN
jgi:hypothetical protein